MHLRALLAVALLLGAGVARPAGAAACAPAAAVPVQADLPVLHVEVTADRPTYRRGQVATIRVAVTQLVAGGTPVREAVTEVDLAVGRRVVKRVGGSTGPDGRLVLRFVVPPRSPVGQVRADAVARTRLMISPECEDLLTASGRATVDPLLTLR